MKTRINESSAYCYELLMLPSIGQFDDQYSNLIGQWRHILAADESVFDQVQEELARLSSSINSFYLQANGQFFVTELIDCFPKFPDDIESLIELLGQMDEATILKMLAQLLQADQPEALSAAEVFDLLLEESFTTEQYWAWAKAIHDPLAFIDGFCQLVFDLDRFYQPIYRQYEKERSDYAQRLDVEDLLRRLPMISTDFIEGLQLDEIWVTILSPIFPQLVIMKHHNRGILLLSTRHEKLWTGHELSQEDFFDLLKLLSDPTRYQVLVRASQAEWKAKDIAEELGITPAAVSYHVSRLADALLLIYQNPNDKASIKINQELIRSLIQRLSEDLGLDE